MKPSIEACKKVAEFWTNKFMSPSFDNGDNSPQSSLASELAKLNLAMSTDVEVEKYIKFESILIDLLQNTDCDHRESSLYSDYHPSGLLLKAMNESGISKGRAPWKTGTQFDSSGNPYSKEGYGAPWRRI